MASVTNLLGRWSFRTLANLFKDALRTQPVTVADGTETALGYLDMGPNGYGATSNLPIKVVTLGGQPAVQFTGVERIDLPLAIATQAAASDAQHEVDMLFYIPPHTMAVRETLFSFGRSSSSNDSAIYDICLEPGGVLSHRVRPQTGGNPLYLPFGTWEPDKPIALTMARMPDGKMRVLLNGTDLAEIGAGSTGTGNYNYATIGASRNNGAGGGTRFFVGYMLTFRNYGPRTEADRIADHNELYASRPTVVASPSLAITNEANLRAFSRRRSPVFPIAGTIGNVPGTPAKLFTRIVKADGTVVKPYVDTGAVFSFATATPSFSGGKVEDMPVGTGLYLEHEVRAGDGTVLATIKSVISFMVGAKVLMGGSSTIDRFGYEYTSALSAAAGMHFQANPSSAGGNYAWNTSVGAARNIITEMFGAIAMPVAIINAGVGATTLGGSWAANTASGMAVLIEAVNRTGPGFDLLCLGVGANDSFKPYDANNQTTITNDHDHARKLGVTRGLILTAIGQADIDTIVVGMNNRENDTDQPIGSDGSARGTMGRGGEIIFVRSLPRAAYVSSMDAAVAAGDIHLTQGGQETLCTRIGQAGGRLFNAAGSLNQFHPFITKATMVADGAILTVQHVLGNDLSAQPATGYSGFRVYDDLGALVADSENAATTVTKVSATEVKVPFAVNAARAYIIAVQNGTWTKPRTNILKDNTGLPVEPTIMGVGEAMVGGQRYQVTN